MNNIIQQLINGIALGGIYALIALGYTMVYGIISLINFAYGDIYMIGAFVGLTCAVSLGLNMAWVLLFAMAATLIIGIVIEQIAYKPLRASSRLSALISTIGVSIFLRTLMVLIKGPSTKGFPSMFENKMYTFGSVQITNYQIIIIGSTALLMLALALFVKYTKTGRAMRATSLDYDAAGLVGINVNRTITITFAIGSALAGAAGVLAGIYFNAVQPYMGELAGIKAFSAAILGGIGSVSGAMVGGLIIGLLEVFSVALGLSEYKDMFAFGIMILVLLVKPNGLFGKKKNKKV